jgi:superfamily II DNA or RNA helicase
VRLEELQAGTDVLGLLPGGTARVLAVEWVDDNTIELTFRDGDGSAHTRVLDREDESRLAEAEGERAFSLDSNPEEFLLAAEARRIRFASLWDPYAAVHASAVRPLPHQISAVYEEMLPRQPLRFLLADDPGAGKTIMSGLLIKELMLRGDLERCLIVSPGSLVEQWQDELRDKFGVVFEILTRDAIEASASGNPFDEKPLCIARLDQLSRSEELQELLRRAQEWDLVVADEAHKMSATYFGNELKATKRYHLGELLGDVTRNLLLLTATPHNGKEEDFQAFLKLLDPDRFEGRFRPGVHQVDPHDLMRRMIKEDLITFENKPLFPERRAYTAEYPLSELETELYTRVTEYVSTEMNRAKAVADGSQRVIVGFALTILQRRLASSPAAIHESLKRRKSRLEKTLEEVRAVARGDSIPARSKLEGLNAALDSAEGNDLAELLDDFEDEVADDEREETEEQVLDAATAARTIPELEAEIASLVTLERLAARIRSSGTDSKWQELRKVLEGESGATAEDVSVVDDEGSRRKFIVFTEHRDTLVYLVDRISGLLGDRRAVVAIYGGMGRDERRKIQELFLQDKHISVLVATDAAGEGVNLQRAHLMVNYDLPWNPNRLEQRFGRIHRIGQTEVCHLWNLVAHETREGAVYYRLLKKLETESKALEGKVFDVLGKVFRETSLRALLLEAIEYGDRPEVREYLHRTVDDVVSHERLLELAERDALATDSIPLGAVQKIRDDMERAALRRLQPHFVARFFMSALDRLRGQVSAREPGRWEIRRVPAPIRAQDRLSGSGRPILDRYERVTFEPERVQVKGKPEAKLISPGDPLLDATVAVIRGQLESTVRKGTILVDPEDPGTTPRMLVFCDSDVEEAPTSTDDARPRVISRRTTMVELTAETEPVDAGWAPYLDYRPATAAERAVVGSELEDAWLGPELEKRARSFATARLTRNHFDEVHRRVVATVEHTRRAVEERLTKEIELWWARAHELKEQEIAGKRNAKLNSGLCARRAEELEARLAARLQSLDRRLNISRKPAVVVGGALIIPAGLLQARGVDQPDLDYPDQETRDAMDEAAIAAVMEAERQLGHEPQEMPHNNKGYDIESRDGKTSDLRFIEVKAVGATKDLVSISYNQVLQGANSPDSFILAIVRVRDGEAEGPAYVRGVFSAPQEGIARIQFEVDWLLGRATRPS